jgi:hypothetical protein
MACLDYLSAARVQLVSQGYDPTNVASLACGDTMFSGITVNLRRGPFVSFFVGGAGAIGLNLIVSFAHISNVWLLIFALLLAIVVACLTYLSSNVGSEYKERAAREKMISLAISLAQASSVRPSQGRRIPLALSVNILDGGHVTITEGELVELIKPRITLAIIGDAGSGKTSLLRLISRQMAEAAVRDDDLPVPVMISAGRYLPSGMDLEKLLTDITKLDYDIIDEWLTLGRLVLFVDGLDEIPPEGQLRLREQFDQMHAKRPKLCMVFTSRPSEREILPNADITVSILPPTREQITHFFDDLVAERLLAGNAVTGLLKDISSRPELREFTRSPLYLQMLLAGWQNAIDREPIESDVAEELFNRAIREGESSDAWLAYQALIGHASQRRVAAAAETLSDYFLGSGDVESAQRAYQLASERFEPSSKSAPPVTDVSSTERKILAVLRSNVTYDIAQVISATSLSPSDASNALDSLINKGAVLRIGSDSDPRYVSVEEILR